MIDLEGLLKVLDPEPVLVNQQSCLRARHRGSACRRCSDTCPVHAIEFVDGRLTVGGSTCIRCGLCAGACPTAALTVRCVREEALDGAAAVRCAKAAGAGVELPCLGWLTLDHVLDLGSRCPGVTLAAGDCSTCSLSVGGKRAMAVVEAASAILTALGVDKLPVWGTEAAGSSPSAVPAMTRRELFDRWRHSALQTGRSVLPDREVNPLRLPARVPARRLRWLKRFAATAGPESLPWPARAVAAGCIGCNLCVAFCPTGALASLEDAGTWLLSYQPAACVDCGTCMHLCPRRCLTAGEPPTTREVLGGDRRDLVSVAPENRPRAEGWRPER